MASHDRTQQPYRRSVRLPGYDYGQQGAYFVTICTHERRPFFADERVREFAEGRWLAIPDHAPAELDVWVVMPNHMHGILAIRDSDVRRGVRQNAQVDGNPGVLANALTGGPTHAKARIAGNWFSQISPSANSLATVVRSYKAAVTGLCRSFNLTDFAWQRGYYEHVIRSEAELRSIRQYIVDNPTAWELDPDNPLNVARFHAAQSTSAYLRDAGV